MAFFQQYDPTVELRCRYNNTENFKKDCLYNLQIQLFVVFGSMIVINNLLEVFIPWVVSLFAKKKQEKIDRLLHDHDNSRNGALLTSIEEEYLLEDYDSTLGDYEELGNFSVYLHV